jgi:hypothetical protein
VLSVAPRRRQSLSGKPRGILGGKENCDAGDIVRLSEASKWRACDRFLLKVAAHNAATARPFGVNDARCNGVDAYFSLVARFNEIRTELTALGEAADLDDFIPAWLPPNPDTDLLAETVALCRQEVTTIPELYKALYATITEPEVPLEVTEVRIMSLHKSKGTGRRGAASNDNGDMTSPRRETSRYLSSMETTITARAIDLSDEWTGRGCDAVDAH